MKKTQQEQVEHISFNQILKAKLGSSKKHDQQDEQPSNSFDLKPDLKSDLDEIKYVEKVEENIPQAQIIQQDPDNQAKDQEKAKNQENSLANSARPANSVELGWQIASLANSARLADNATPVIAKPLESQAILATLTPTQGFLKLPNWILDSLPTLIDSNEQLMYIHLYRLSHGFGKDQCLVSLDKLAERTGFSKRTVQTVLQNLENKGLISKLGHNFGKGVIQGTIFRVATIASLAEVASPVENASLAKFTTIKDHDDDDLKEIDHHQKEVMMIYQSLTGNNSWTKSDKTAYQKIKHLPLKEVATLIKSTLEKAHQKPASLAYFVKVYQNPTEANPTNREINKRKIEAIMKRLRESHVGSAYTMADLAFDVKTQCAREGIVFDNNLFNELLEKKNN